MLTIPGKLNQGKTKHSTEQQKLIIERCFAIYIGIESFFYILQVLLHEKSHIVYLLQK